MTRDFGTTAENTEIKMLCATIKVLQTRIDRYRSALMLIANLGCEETSGERYDLIEFARRAINYEDIMTRLEKQNG